MNLNDATSPMRISDHDPAVAYFAIPPVQGTVQLITTAILALHNDGSYQATVTLKNNGTGTECDVDDRDTGQRSRLAVPATLGDVQPEASTTMIVNFSASAGATGPYMGGTFGGSIRAVLPSSGK